MTKPLEKIAEERARLKQEIIGNHQILICSYNVDVFGIKSGVFLIDENGKPVNNYAKYLKDYNELKALVESFTERFGIDKAVEEVKEELKKPAPNYWQLKALGKLK
ncbi:hypothetical protein HYX16_03320 [Candidatus Woesearchaeota archaeon]|nr:hypothetical protein [Candidatus Woesearchaeota archaeon]